MKQVVPLLEEDHHDLEEGSTKADAVQAAVPVHKINEEADEAEAVVAGSSSAYRHNTVVPAVASVMTTSSSIALSHGDERALEACNKV